MKEALQADCTRYAPGTDPTSLACNMQPASPDIPDTLLLKALSGGAVAVCVIAGTLSALAQPAAIHTAPSSRSSTRCMAVTACSPCQHCSERAAGVDILSVRVTKPSIPDSIVANFRAMEEERTKELIAQARERVAVREAEIERVRAVMHVRQASWAGIRPVSY